MAGVDIAVSSKSFVWVGFCQTIPASHIQAALENPDSIQIASELGRLDFVSGLLAAIGVVLALAAVFGFWLIRGAAMNAASQAARAEMHELLPKDMPGACAELFAKRPELIVAALRHDPSLLLSVLQEAKDTLFSDIDPSEAENIARSVDDGGLKR